MKTLVRKLRKKVKNDKGEGYIDLVISISVIIVVTYMCILIFPVFIAKQNVDYMAKSIVRTVEMTGEQGMVLRNEIDNLKRETGLAPSIDIIGDFDSGRLQIRERFSVTVRDYVDIVFARSIFGNELSFSIPVSKSLTGMSEVYFKDM